MRVTHVMSLIMAPPFVSQVQALAMTTHLKHLPSWRSSSLSGDEDAMVVIQQFTDGDDQDAQEVMDAIKQFAEEDDFQVRIFFYRGRVGEVFAQK